MFRFRFESVLGYRRNLEERAQYKMIRSGSQLVKQQGRLQELERARDEAVSFFEERKRQPLAAPFYTLFVEGIERRERELASQQRAVAAQVEVVEQARRELREKMQQRQIMEKARERDYEQYLLQQRRREQNYLDEQTILRFKKA